MTQKEGAAISVTPDILIKTKGSILKSVGLSHLVTTQVSFESFLKLLVDKMSVLAADDNDTLCLELTDADLSTYATFQWWVSDVTERVVGIAGLVANVVAVVVLSRKEMASNFNHLLMFLAVCDMAVILFTLLEDFNNKFVHPSPLPTSQPLSFSIKNTVIRQIAGKRK